MNALSTAVSWLKQHFVTIITWPFKVIGKLTQWVFILLGITILFYGGKEFYDYHHFAHAYGSDAPCPTVLGELGLDSLDRTGAVRCINVSDQQGTLKVGERRHLVLFSAIEPQPGDDLQGHGFVTFVALTRLDSGELQLDEFIPTGFAPQSEQTLWPDNLVSYHATVQRHLPTGVEPMVTKLMQSFYLPMELTEYGGPYLDNGSAILNSEFMASAAFRAAIGDENQSILAVTVSAIEYENAKRYRNKFVLEEYGYDVGDATAFVHTVADKVNLYTPPQVIGPMPIESLTAISEMNRKVGQ
ncbi:hypothetical protein [Ferrimonas balearica]|uniref:hypothetical protein n=1 Tax=Ferrimonas balearica TaxID=44012 RepID=UPI001C9902EC|nr:hypothetical protein [Ferrimonas balearica]MBY5990909.1 hypothetical protein [Ferrimonas balearica]